MTQKTQPPRPDPIGDFQRWLMKSGAKGLGREVRGNLRRTFGRPSEEDVWSQATREYPDEPPECEWCPICRAARKYRDNSGPGVGGHLTGAGDAFASVVSDAFSAFESALSVVRPPSAPKASPGPAGSTGSPASSGPAGSARPAARLALPGRLSRRVRQPGRSRRSRSRLRGRVGRGGGRVRGRRQGGAGRGAGYPGLGHGRAGRVGSGHRGRPGRSGR